MSEFESDLEEDLKGDTSGYFGRLMISLVNAGREESEDVDYGLAAEDAQKIKAVTDILFYVRTVIRENLFYGFTMTILFLWPLLGLFQTK